MWWRKEIVGRAHAVWLGCLGRWLLRLGRSDGRDLRWEQSWQLHPRWYAGAKRSSQYQRFCKS